MSYMAALLARHAALESPRAALLRRLGGGVVRRRRGGGRRFGGFLGLRLLLHHFHRPDRALVQQHQRDRERHLAEHVGRRQYGGQNEGADDEIAPLLPELLRGDEADAAEQREDDRQLERHAEGEHQRHHQREIFADLGQKRDRRLVR